MSRLFAGNGIHDSVEALPVIRNGRASMICKTKQIIPEGIAVTSAVVRRTCLSFLVVSSIRVMRTVVVYILLTGVLSNIECEP